MEHTMESPPNVLKLVLTNGIKITSLQIQLLLLNLLASTEENLEIPKIQ